MRLEAAVGGALFTASVLCSAAFGHDIGHGLKRRHADLHLMQKRAAEPTKTVNIVKRADVFGAPSGVWPTVPIPAGFTLAGGVEVTALPSADFLIGSNILTSAVAIITNPAEPTQKNTKADLACMDAVMRLNGVASNPSGMAACYNVPFLDTNRGIFESELRIFNLSMPAAEFVGVPADRMMVTFQFQSASLQSSDGTLPVKRSLVERQMPAMTMNPAPGQTGAAWMPMEVSVRRYVGQLNPGSFNPQMNLTDFKALLTPQITISAQNPVTNQNVATLLSPTEASFVDGIFTTMIGSLNDPAYLLDKPAEKIAAAAQGLPTPFIVPGLSLNVFPTGLIVASVWLLAFLSTVGFGTLGRIQFREQYRREMRMYMSADVKRI